MNFFKKAERKAKPSTGLVSGPSGSGKSYSALAIMSGLVKTKGGRFCVIDSENSSAELYADIFDFDHANLDNSSTDSYCKAIDAAVAGNYSGVVIDSLSHAWEHLLQDAEDAQVRTKGNSFTAWKHVTPIYRKLIEAIVSCPIHVIATARAKTEYVLEEQERNGKKYQVPKRVGLAPVFRQGGEYEFDWIGTLDLEHRLVIEKSRYAFLADRVVTKPGPELGEEIAKWLTSGAAVAVVETSLDRVRGMIARNDFGTLGLHCLETACSQKGRTVSDLVGTENNWCVQTLTSSERLAKLTPADKEALIAYQNWFSARSTSDHFSLNKEQHEQ